jgi:argininosuccinate lyase
MKGLPLAYNKDLQEDKEPLFNAMEQLSLCLRVLPRILDGMKVRRDVCREAALGGYANATELADYLVGKGIPFREAHDVVGQIVRVAIERKARLEDLPLEVLQRVSPVVEADVAVALRLETGLARREVAGGTGPASVASAITHAKQRLSHNS